MQFSIHMTPNKHKQSLIHNSEFSITHVPSSYRKLPVTVYVKKASQTSRVALVLHPGAFENVWGDDDRYKKILLWLQQHLSYHPHIIAFQTSRLPIPLPNISLTNPTYWQQKENYWKQAFTKKMFQQELQDVRLVYQYIVDRLKINEIHTLGFSFGGTLAMILTSEFSQIRKLCVIGSAISTKRKYLPILSGYPTKQWIINRIKKFPYYFKIIQGTEDHVVPTRDAQEIVQSMKSTMQTSFDRFAGADHMFSGKNQYRLFSYQSFLPHLKHFFEFKLSAYEKRRI